MEVTPLGLFRFSGASFSPPHVSNIVTGGSYVDGFHGYKYLFSHQSGLWVLCEEMLTTGPEWRLARARMEGGVHCLVRLYYW